MKDFIEFLLGYPLWVKAAVIVLAGAIVMLLVFFHPENTQVSERKRTEAKNGDLPSASGTAKKIYAHEGIESNGLAMAPEPMQGIKDNPEENQPNKQTLTLASLPRGSRVTIEITAIGPEEEKIVYQKLEAVLRQNGHTVVELVFPEPDHDEPPPRLGAVFDDDETTEFLRRVEILGVTHILKVDAQNDEVRLLLSNGKAVGVAPLSEWIR